jgi:hypothetical protein
MPDYPFVIPTPDLQRRFWAKVNKIPDECWMWTSAVTGTGRCYGVFRINGLTYRANRVAWMLTRGPIPDGWGVLHTCDNPWCVNPDHLFIGTQKINMEDKKGKGRTHHLFGEDSGRHKLKEKEVLWARRVYIPRHPEFGARALARRFKVSHTAMEHALHGVNWPYL